MCVNAVFNVKNYEYEIKQLITEDVYNYKLFEMQKMSSSETIIQINYYYDTPEYEMFNNDKTIRVRLKNNGMKLECKFNSCYINNTRVCDEYSKPINYLPQSVIIDHNTLLLIGCMTTIRTNFKFENYLISFDKNYYLGKIDYEIEVESKTSISTPIQLLDIINGKLMTVGKYTRFISALKDMKKRDVYKVDNYYI